MPMPPSILFIHGRGTNPDLRGWIEPLRESIRDAGHTPPSVDGDAFLTVDYRDLLENDVTLADLSMPQVTLPQFDADARREFLDRAAQLRTRLTPPRTWLTAQQLLDVVTAMSVARFPVANLAIQDRTLLDLVTRIMGDVERYKSRARLRANVLHRVLDLTADHDELIIIGHSLGSVVAVDALSYLPADLHVPLLITMGSPLSFRSIREIGLPGQHHPWPFPHAKVDRWVNVVDTFDAVTGFTGIRSWWPEVVDADVDNPTGRRHAARAYLAHRFVGELVGEARGVSRAPARASFQLDTDLRQGFEHEQLLAEIALHYSRLLFESEDDGEARSRARLARDQLLSMAGEAAGRKLTPDLCEGATHSWRDRSSQLERRLLLSRLAVSNPFEPFDPDLSASARKRALIRFAKELTVPDPTDSVEDLLELLDKTQRALKPRSRVKLRPILIGVSTIGLVAVAAPAAVGLFAAAGAGGAAAFTSGLAAMGAGGGMSAGIGVLTGIGAGGGLLAGQLARSGADQQAVLASLIAIGATIRWLRRWGDDDIARQASQVADSLPQLAREYQAQLDFHDGRSAPDSDAVDSLKESHRQCHRLTAWLNEMAASDQEHRSPSDAEDTDRGTTLEPVRRRAGRSGS
jgi:hypothetical protein